MDKDSGDNRQYIQRHHTRTEEKEEHSKDRSRPTSTIITEKTKHQRRFKRTLTQNIINLSRSQLKSGETSLLSKGLNFIPTLKKEHPAKLLQDIVEAWYYLEQYIGLKEDKLSSTTVDFIGSHPQ